MPSTAYSGDPYSQPNDPTGMFPPNFADMGVPEMGMSESFQQPFVPQDLWQMPMTLEWDWADVGAMSGIVFDDGMGLRPDANGGGMDGGQPGQ